jgi:branched-chain amino acid transport system permease protein
VTGLKKNKHTKKSVAFLILGLVLILFPLVIKNIYYQRVIINAGIYVILASSLNLLIGYLGLFSMGHAAFFCIGAYTSALLATRLGVPFILCFLAAGAMAALFGALIGFATLRLNDIFLMFATLSLSEVIRILIQNMVNFTGGPMGVSKIPVPTLFGKPFNSSMFYYLVLIVAAAVIYITNRLMHSNTGRTMVAIREDESAAKSLGINVFKYKMITMVISCFIAGIAGSIFAHFLQYISATMFSINESTNMIAMVVIGGMGTVSGPVIGALILTLIPEVFRFLSEYRQFMYGAVLIISIIFAPRGLVGFNYSKILAWKPIAKIKERISGEKRGE